MRLFNNKYQTTEIAQPLLVRDIENNHSSINHNNESGINNPHSHAEEIAAVDHLITLIGNDPALSAQGNNFATLNTAIQENINMLIRGTALTAEEQATMRAKYINFLTIIKPSVTAYTGTGLSKAEFDRHAIDCFPAAVNDSDNAFCARIMLYSLLLLLCLLPLVVGILCLIDATNGYIEACKDDEGDRDGDCVFRKHHNSAARNQRLKTTGIILIAIPSFFSLIVFTQCMSFLVSSIFFYLNNDSLERITRRNTHSALSELSSRLSTEIISMKEKNFILFSKISLLARSVSTNLHLS